MYSTQTPKQLLLMLSIVTLGLTACENEQGVTARLTSRERTRIDTLYSLEVTELRPQWDSLCEVRHDSLVAFAVDSIVRVRAEEEERLRQRILQAQRQAQ